MSDMNMATPRQAGTLYGVSLGGAFFGESMFSLEDEASRAALAALDARLTQFGYTMLDGQLPHEGLSGYAFQVVPRSTFLANLAVALQHPDRSGSWTNSHHISVTTGLT